MRDPSATPVVAVRGVDFRHPGAERDALTGVDLAVHPGEVVVLMGPNGSGKSTLLRLLAGLARPDAGTVEVLGRAPWGAPPGHRRRVGVAFDVPAHLDALDGRANAALLGRAAGLAPGEAARRGAALLDRFGLGDDAGGKPVGAWSYGMRRKLLVAEALLADPGVLLLDEPGLGLDVDARATLEALVAAAAARGAAAVVALNDPALAGAVADRVVFLRRGAVVADASPSDLLARLGGRTRIEVALEIPPEGSVAWPPGAAGRLDGATATAEVDDVRALPDVLRALQASGAGIASASVRAPDLADVFLALTGEAWRP